MKEDKIEIAERMWKMNFPVKAMSKILGYKSKASLETVIARERKKNNRFLPIRNPKFKPRLILTDLPSI